MLLSRVFFLRCFVSCIALFFFGVAQAQSAVTANPIQLSVVGGVARINTPISLILSGSRQDSCIPTGASISRNQNFQVLITVRPAPIGTACAEIPATWQFNLTAGGFERSGIYQVEVVDDGGFPMASLELNVQNGEQAISARSVSGSWYEPASSGSGLMLSHDRANEQDSVFGVWHNFAPDGSSSWFSLRGGNWITPTELDGEVFETTGERRDGVCTAIFPPDASCANPLRPVPYATFQSIGRYQISVLSNSRIDLRLTLNGGASTRTIQLQKL